MTKYLNSSIETTVTNQLRNITNNSNLTTTYTTFKTKLLSPAQGILALITVFTTGIILLAAAGKAIELYSSRSNSKKLSRKDKDSKDKDSKDKDSKDSKAKDSKAKDSKESKDKDSTDKDSKDQSEKLPKKTKQSLKKKKELLVDIAEEEEEELSSEVEEPLKKRKELLEEELSDTEEKSSDETKELLDKTSEAQEVKGQAAEASKRVYNYGYANNQFLMVRTLFSLSHLNRIPRYTPIEEVETPLLEEEEQSPSVRIDMESAEPANSTNQKDQFAPSFIWV